MRSRKITMWLMVMVLMVFCLGLSETKATVVFNDGGTHTLDWVLDDSVKLLNSPLSQPTTLNLVTGGWISGWLHVYDSSQVGISGGSIGSSLFAYDYSQVNISGGMIEDSLDAHDSSQANISGGLIGHDLLAYDYSQVSISSGSIGKYLYAYNYSQVNISGGSIGTSLYAYNYSLVNISGGSIGNDLDARDSSQVSISGGLIGASLFAYDNSQVDIFGGQIIGTGSGALYALGSSQITIYGSGFNYPYGDITGSGILTGILASGELINNRFEIYPDARILLVPEPATLLLLGLGAVMLRKRTRLQKISQDAQKRPIEKQ